MNLNRFMFPESFVLSPENLKSIWMAMPDALAAKLEIKAHYLGLLSNLSIEISNRVSEGLRCRES